MPVSSSVLTVGKYVFLSLVVTGAGFLIATMTVVERHTIEPLDDLVYKYQISPSSDKVLLDKSYNRCLSSATYTVCMMAANKKLTLHRPNAIRTPVAHTQITVKHQKHPIVSALREFSRVARSLHVRPVVLEASVLFCVLSAFAKIKLLLQGFRLHGSRNFITLGITEEESRILDQEKSLMSVMNSGFDVSRIRRWFLGEEIRSVHFFLQREGSTIHLVVLMAGQNYKWHSGHDRLDLQDPIFSREALYENFTTMPLKAGETDFYLPSDPLHLLLQIYSSEFRKCSQSDDASFFQHPILTSDQLLKRTQVAIQEIKILLNPYYIPFWLCSDSLQGWREACNIFSNTSEVNLAVFTLKNMNLSVVLQDNPYLQYSWSDDKAGRFSLDCHGLVVNIFVADEDGNTLHSKGDGRETSDSRVYPKFRLCTTDVFGLRVHVPCN